MKSLLNNNLGEDLIIGFLDGTISDDELIELKQWLDSDESNRRMFEQYSELWIANRALLAKSGYDHNKGFSKFKERIYSSKKNIKHTSFVVCLMRYVAVFAIALSIGWWISSTYSQTINAEKDEASNKFSNELIVPKGGNAKFRMSDGTIITLFADSQLKFSNDYGTKNRDVELDGEAFFEVAKDSTKQFRVITSLVTVTALGTVFNVKSYSEDNFFETFLAQGSIAIKDNMARKSSDTIAIMLPNQRLSVYREDNEAISKLETINAANDNAWRENYLMFENKPLSTLVIELGRRFGYDFIFTSENVKSYKFTGVFISESIEQIMGIIANTAPINYSIKGRSITISKRTQKQI